MLATVAAAGALVWFHDPGRRAGEHFAKAVSHLEGGATAAAIIELRNVIQLDPGHRQARFVLGKALLRTGRGKAAKSHLDRARELGLDEPELEELRIRALLMQEDYRQALESSSGAGAGVPDGDGTTTLLELKAAAQLGSRQVDAAWTTYSRILDLDEDNPEARRGMARIAVHEGDIEGARRQIDLALESGGAHGGVQTFLLEGELELSLGHFDSARESFLAVHERQPDNPYGRAGLARALLGLDRLDAAAEHVTYLRQRRRDDPIVSQLVSRLADRRGDHLTAKRALHAAVTTEPDDIRGQLELARMMVRDGELAQAEARLLGLSEDRPDLDAPNVLLAQIKLDESDPRAAIALLEPLHERMPDNPRLIEMLATAHGQAGDSARARALLARVAELVPDDPAVTLMLAVQSLHQSDPDSAVRQLRDALGRDPDLAGGQSLLLMALLERGQGNDADHAIELAHELLRRYPGNPRALNGLGAALEASGDRAGARQRYTEALAADPNYVTAGLNVARLDEAGGDIAAARAGLEQVLRRNPDHVAALTRRALLAFRAGEESTGFELIERAREAQPRALLPHLVLARVLLKRQRYDEALHAVRAALTVAPEDARARLVLGRIQIRGGDPVGALSTLGDLVEQFPDSARAHFYLALAYERCKLPERTREHLERVLELDPGHYYARLGVAQLDLAKGDLEAAARTADVLGEARPEELGAHLLRADVLRAKGDTEQALRVYRELDARQGNELTLKRLHGLYVETGRFDDAVSVLRDHLAGNPDDVRLRLILAGTFERAGRPDLAIVEYERVLVASPGHRLAMNNLAWALHRKGDERALTAAEQAFVRHPGSPYVADTLGWILISRGKATRGLDLVAGAMQQLPGDAAIAYHHAAGLAATGDVRAARVALRTLLDSPARFDERPAALALLRELPES